MEPLAFLIFAEKYRCENGWSTTPRFISFPLRTFWSKILWRKRPERKDEVHEFPVWNVHEAHGRSTAVGRNAPSRTQTIILQVVYCSTDWISMCLHTQIQYHCVFPQPGTSQLQLDVRLPPSSADFPRKTNYLRIYHNCPFCVGVRMSTV